MDCRDKLAVAAYQDELAKELGQLPDMGGLSMKEADKLLHDISSKSLLPLPGKKLSNIKTHRYIVG